MGDPIKWPANSKLFDVNKASPKLNNRDQDYFNWMVARLLFMAKRAKPDLQVVVAFLCTRVSAPTKEDYIK